jgi:hypothetical protein
MDLTPDEIVKYKTILLNLVPKDGAAIGNKKVRLQITDEIKQEFGKTISEEDYWTIRNGLMAEGKITKGRGNGGSILLVKDIPLETTPLLGSNKRNREYDLYEPLYKTITSKWLKDYYGIEDFVAEITANSGRRNTGGDWTRPDIALYAVRTYQYIPYKQIELITFEVKPLNHFYIGGVFETASHSAIAHRSYLMIYVSKSQDDATEPLLERLDSQAERMRIGFITFEDPKDADTFNVRVDAPLQQPDPADICNFIEIQFSQQKQQEIFNYLRF